MQVELAQLNYRASRLMGQGVVLSRLAGGIGTRGPGESKLEISRRRIRERTADLRRELAEMEKQRSVRRKSREKSAVPLVALVGYTNTGKSSLLNTLTGASVYAENKLFATLDAVSRKVETEDGAFLLVDTVGFIRNLPHTLIEAFKSTLEEVVYADVLLIISDGLSPEMEAQHATVLSVLEALGATEGKRIEVINKCDDGQEPSSAFPGAICVSAREGHHLDQLLKAIGKALFGARMTVSAHIPFSGYSMLADVRRLAKITGEKHDDTGTLVTMQIASEDKRRLAAKYGETFFV